MSTGESERRFGKYALLNEVGRGAMGIVYRASQEDGRPIVALKILPSETTDSEERGRFDREARTAASLHHANIVRIHETGAIDGSPFYAMDFIDGKPLSTILKERGHLPVNEALELLVQVAMAMHFAHEHGVVHRDIKPANILVDKAGCPFLCDFGLAKSAHDPAMAMTGMILGTPYYMSPEQADGRTKEIDARSDVYALGAVAYQVLTGALPFSEQDFRKLLDQIRTERPMAPSQRREGLSSDIDAVILAAMSKDPRKRYPTGLEMAEDLRRLLEGKPTQMQPPPMPVTTARNVSVETTRFGLPHVAARSNALLFIGIGIAVAAVIGIAIAVSR